MRVLYSFPHKIGASRICYTAWHQVVGLARAGVSVDVHPGVVHKPLPTGVTAHPTLARGRLRLPYRALGGLRTFRLHDEIVARRLPKIAPAIDVVHTWPLGAKRTLEVAAELGIPTVLERPNAHTQFAYEIVRDECERIGVALPPGHEHAYNEETLRREEEEYALADYLLCPSDFVARTFLERGFPAEKLVRHIYGFDPGVFYPPSVRRSGDSLTALFVGVAAVRKGLHLALDAWLRSSASADGRFLIAGAVLPDYERSLSGMLAHPRVEVLGHRQDVADIMRASDILVLPTLEEGSALVCGEALGCGCVPVVSDAASGVCHHMENALVHRAGDVGELSRHLTLLHDDRLLLERLRAGVSATAPRATWERAGEVLAAVYRNALAASGTSQPPRRTPGLRASDNGNRLGADRKPRDRDVAGRADGVDEGAE